MQPTGQIVIKLVIVMMYAGVIAAGVQFGFLQVQFQSSSRLVQNALVLPTAAVTTAPVTATSPAAAASVPSPPAELPPLNTPTPVPLFAPTLSATSRSVSASLPKTTATPPPRPTFPPTPAALNGLPMDDILWLPPEVLAHSQQIFALGQVLGRDPGRFSKLGDSVAATEHYLTWFDQPGYKLGEYSYLERVITPFAGSFARPNITLRKGLNSWGVFDPVWADKNQCEPNEDMLACEIRLHNPAVMFIILGTNDWSEEFEDNLSQIASYCEGQGVIPVIVTKANRVEGSNWRNEAMRRVATAHNIPVLDFDLVAETLPGRGLDEDATHMTVFPEHDYTLPWVGENGYALYNLTTLMMLDALWQQILR